MWETEEIGMGVCDCSNFRNWHKFSRNSSTQCSFKTVFKCLQIRGTSHPHRNATGARPAVVRSKTDHGLTPRCVQCAILHLRASFRILHCSTPRGDATHQFNDCLLPCVMHAPHHSVQRPRKCHTIRLIICGPSCLNIHGILPGSFFLHTQRCFALPLRNSVEGVSFPAVPKSVIR